MYYVKLLMDADCLIKLTKSGLKEVVCLAFSITIPLDVKAEVVDNAPEHMDSIAVRDNLEKRLLKVGRTPRAGRKGEEAVFASFREGRFDAVCSDDRRFIRRLGLLGVPYITPAVFVLLLVQQGRLDPQEALAKLDSLAPFISDDECETIKSTLQRWRTQ